MQRNDFDVVVIGGGISACALFYQLAAFSEVKSVAMIEKYGELASLNSKGTSNSQTIHYGDIETNYSYEKAAKVKVNADMVANYAAMHGKDFLHSHQKMALAVGERECSILRARFLEFSPLFPGISLFEREDLERLEPLLLKDRKAGEEVVAMGFLAGKSYTTVDFGKMSNALAKDAKEAAREQGRKAEVFLNEEITEIIKQQEGYEIRSKRGSIFWAKSVVVNAGAHSLYLAHKMQHGLHYSCLPVAGSFYLTHKKLLNGKVYMMQNPKLPFAALHADPDLLADMNTRFGPTALMLPKLERYHGMKSFFEFWTTLRLDMKVVKILLDLMKDSEIRNYVLYNYLFEIPLINKKLFLKDARKIVPSLQGEDIYYAKGFGGVRPQVMDKAQRKLILGEASIRPGEGLIFNMTPSPGATSCFGNALRDVREVCDYLGVRFREEAFNAAFVKAPVLG